MPEAHAALREADPAAHDASLNTREAYLKAIGRLYALGQELAPLPPLPDGTPAPRRKWDLAHMRTLCAALGDPQQTFPSVLIAGTNGKGSSAATLASICRAAGYKTGLYTSPHLVRVNERIRVLAPSLDENADILTLSNAKGKNPEGSRVTGTARTFIPKESQEKGLAFPHLASETWDVNPPPSSSASASIAPLPHAIGGMETIPDAAFARLFTSVDDTASNLVATKELPHPPSFFEVLTALAFLYFAEEKIDIAILEVGLGGRLDATNIVDPILSVITDIALDHQEYLGTTIAEITREKAGILRANGTLITLPQHPDANQTIGEAAALLNLHAINAAEFIPSQIPSSIPHPRTLSSFAAGGGPASSKESKDPDAAHTTKTARTFLPPESESWVSHPSQLDGDGRDVRPQIDHEPLSLPRNRYTVTLDNQPLIVDSPLPGHHQQRNLALAIATAVALRNPRGYKFAQSPETSSHISYNISNAAIEAGIRDTQWPGRLEFLPPNLLLDVAHNPAGAWTLRAAIAQLPDSQPRILIFSCLGDKDLTEISRILFPLFDSSPEGGRSKDHIVLAPMANPRAARVEDLLAAAHVLDIPAHAAPHLAGALAQARAITPAGGLIIATGSVFLVGAIRDLALAGAKQN